MTRKVDAGCSFRNSSHHEPTMEEPKMKHTRDLLRTFAFIIAIFTSSTAITSAQGPNHAPNTKSRIEYHGGLVLVGPVDVYFIWYGCWTNNCGNNGSINTVNLLQDFASNVGGTPYFVINTMYTNDSGYHPSGALFFGGAA